MWQHPHRVREGKKISVRLFWNFDNEFRWRRLKCISHGQDRISAVWNCLGVTILASFFIIYCQSGTLNFGQWKVIDNHMKIHPRSCAKFYMIRWRVTHFYVDSYLWSGNAFLIVMWTVICGEMKRHSLSGGYPCLCEELPAIRWRVIRGRLESYLWSGEELCLFKWRLSAVR